LASVLDNKGCIEAAIAARRRMPYREYLRTAHWDRQRTFALERAPDQVAFSKTCRSDSRQADCVVVVERARHDRADEDRPEGMDRRRRRDPDRVV